MNESIKKFARKMSEEDYENFDVITRLEEMLELLDKGVTADDIKQAISLFDDEDLFYELIFENEE